MPLPIEKEGKKDQRILKRVTMGTFVQSKKITER